jgi:hypothetical protein
MRPVNKKGFSGFANHRPNEAGLGQEKIYLEPVLPHADGILSIGSSNRLLAGMKEVQIMTEPLRFRRKVNTCRTSKVTVRRAVFGQQGKNPFLNGT